MTRYKVWVSWNEGQQWEIVPISPSLLPRHNPFAQYRYSLPLHTHWRTAIRVIYPLRAAFQEDMNRRLEVFR